MASVKLMDSGIDDFSESGPVSTHTSYDITFSSYAEFAGIAVCFVIALVACIRSRNSAAQLVCIGFAFLLAKYSMSFLYVTANERFIRDMIVVDRSFSWLGPLGLLFIACGLKSEFVRPREVDQSNSEQ